MLRDRQWPYQLVAWWPWGGIRALLLQEGICAWCWADPWGLFSLFPAPGGGVLCHWVFSEVFPSTSSMVLSEAIFFSLNVLQYFKVSSCLESCNKQEVTHPQ